MSNSSSDNEISDAKPKEIEANFSDDENFYKELKESDTEDNKVETDSLDSDNSDNEHPQEKAGMELEGIVASSSNSDHSDNESSHEESIEVKEADTSSSDEERSYRENSYQECDRLISSSSSDTDSSDSSDVSEYCIELEKFWYDGYNDYRTAPVIGIKRNSVVRRDDLSKLLNSDKPKYKRIINSIVSNAAKYDNYGAFDRLLGAKYKFHILNDKGQTAIHLAFYHQSLGSIFHIAEYMENMDASEPEQKPDRTDFVDCNGLTHLHVASAYASWNFAANYLENNDHINARFRCKEHSFESGFTPLHFAVLNISKYYHARTTQVLVEHGADVNAVDDLGRTPLHLVCYLTSSSSYDNDNDEMIKIMKILVENKSNINAQDNDGNTPPFLVFSSLSEEYFTDPVDTERSNACMEQALQKLKLLLQFNIDVKLRNKDGNTLLHQVIHSLRYLRYSYLDKPDCAFDDSKHIEMLGSLFSSNPEIDVDAKNDAGETPLQLAVAYLSPDIVKLLLEHNADIGNLKISPNNDTFFKYPTIALSLKPMQKLLDIIELLCSEGFLLSLEENLTILKFLTHSHEKCICVDVNYFKLSLFEMFHVMCLDLPEHIEQSLQKLHHRLDDYDPYDENRSNSSIDWIADKMFHNFQKYLFYIIIGNIYVEDRSMRIMNTAHKNFATIKEFGFEMDPDLDCVKEITKDIDTLKSIFLINGESLHQVLMRNPEETANYFINNNFDEKCISNLGFSKDIVKGHATKSLIRYYVQKYAFMYVSMLTEKPLNDMCCLHIIRYLNVKDVFNICLALCD